MRVRFKTKAISIYLCTVTLTAAGILLIVHFYGRDLKPNRRSFEHMAVDRVMMAHELQGLQLPEDKPVLIMEREQRKMAPVKILQSKMSNVETEKPAAPVPHLPERSELSPTEQLTSLSRAAIANLTYADLADLYHNYITTNQLECHDIVRLGHVTDGGWEMCADDQFRPKSPCLVYSFGVDNDFSFDDAAARKYNCEVHSFDPSMKLKDHQRDSSVWFHNKGLADFNGESNNGWKMGTLESIKQSLGHDKRPIAILKMDIEEWEWQVLPEALSTESLSNIKQLLIEFHACKTCSVYNPELIDKEPTKERYIQALNIFKRLYHLGFRIFWSHKNSACKYLSKFGMKERSACHEVHMVQVS